MSRLAEVYLHYEYRDVSDDEFKRLAGELEQRLLEISKRYFSNRGELELVLEDRSWLTKATVLAGGLLLGTYNVVAAYPSFKQGVEELCKNAEGFGDDVCSSVKEVLGVEESQRKYKRTLPQELRALRDFVETIDIGLDLPPDKLRKQTPELSANIERDISILRRADMPEDVLTQLIAFVPAEVQEDLPRRISDYTIRSPGAEQRVGRSAPEHDVARASHRPEKKRHRYERKFSL